ncbi:MAG: acetyl-CoA carboxylase carboxyltransferase subunit alpha [Acidobacteria bacterium]|nr:acetyl-CoA carboxylase carboxyltransferase subunit alpha [Acidobacteriota bacterium]MBI3657126.1 acetyl-CoA carboxylase carboxyltransferase subunit alpha [Acidobacteriota bacterium]
MEEAPSTRVETNQTKAMGATQTESAGTDRNTNSSRNRPAPPGIMDRVRVARHDQRPYTMDYIERLFEDFIEIHGDRKFADDPALIAGMGFFHGQPVMIVGQQKGRDLKQRLHRNFGQAGPEGYRKALRAMELAEKFNRPIISFVDTPGAFPGLGAEERGIAEAIAYNLRTTSRLAVPILVVVIGEGGSGGALGIAVGDYIMMLENAWYSVIAPESCSAIIWRDQEHSEEAAANLHLTAEDLLRFGIIDEILPEPKDGAHTSFDETAHTVDEALARILPTLNAMPTEERLERRYAKFRKLGYVEEGTPV